MVGFLYTVLAVIIGALDGLAKVADGSKWSAGMVEGLTTTFIARFLINWLLEG